MTIQSARVQLNGTWHNLTLNSSTGKWEATITAPNTTSYNLDGGYYPLTVEATNTAGTKSTATVTDTTIGNSLKLVVKEKIAPVITVISPSNNSYVTNNQQPVTFTVVDEVNGSGVDLDTLACKIDGTAATNYTSTAITNGYRLVLTPSASLSDGSHTVTVDCKDHDGNAAVQKSVTFKVDTVPPVLNVITPTDNLITNAASCIVSGTTNDITSSPVTVKIKLNGTDQGAVTVNDNGSFSKTVNLANGENTIVVTATDSAGKISEVTKNVTLDTSVPVFASAAVTPNPVDAGKTVVISVVIEG